MRTEETGNTNNVYEVAKFCGALLVTGNLKHFPEDPLVMSAADFLENQNH